MTIGGGDGSSSSNGGSNEDGDDDDIIIPTLICIQNFQAQKSNLQGLFLPSGMRIVSLNL